VKSQLNEIIVMEIYESHMGKNTFDVEVISPNIVFDFDFTGKPTWEFDKPGSMKKKIKKFFGFGFK